MKKMIINILLKYANETERFDGFIIKDDFERIANEIITVLKKPMREGKNKI